MISSKLFWGGLLFLCLGSAWATLAAGYALGTPTAMGPGFFPLILSILLAVVGLLAIVQSSLTRSFKEPLQLRPLWPCGLVLGSVVAFGMLLDIAGLIPAVLALTAISGAHRLGSRPIELAVIAIVLATATTLLFIYGLQLPFVAIQYGNR